jgi:hypothetical protein
MRLRSRSLELLVFTVGAGALALPPGTPRLADTSDQPLLRSWFKRFRERLPHDPSRVVFVAVGMLPSAETIAISGS